MKHKQQEPIDRTQLDWDIEDARYEMRWTDGYEATERRAKRHVVRSTHLAFLYANIAHAIKYGK